MSAFIVLWLDGARDAPRQMARDAQLLDRAAAGTLPGTVLRLFTFDPPGITLGRSQDPARELDLERLEQAGVRWALRPTGGRAIWHEEEWTFSLVTRLGVDGWAESPGAAYERTARLLADALARLGVPATLSAGSARGVGAPRARSGAAPPCFASVARHELTLAGGKLLGLAQRAVRGALLQQGSLLLGPAHATLARWVRADESAREALAVAAREGSATAGDWLGADRSLERLADALAEALAGECETTRWGEEQGERALALGSRANAPT
jgi:lipoate-protein ligase A